MTGTYGIRVAINGSETYDATDTLELVSRVRITGGGGSWWRTADLLGCSFEMAVPITEATDIRTITVAVTGPQLASTPDWIYDDSGDYYRVVFHGPIVRVKPVGIGEDYCEFDALSEMQTLFERRARTAATNNTGHRSLLADIETAHSITVNENGSVPDTADTGLQLDRPVQRGASNGEWLRKNMAGTGQSIVEEWDGPITAPTLCWRTDYYFSGAPRRQFIPAKRPWMYSYEDIGTTWQDFVAKVSIEGEGSGGTRYWGTAALGDATTRQQLGNTEVSLDTWIDNDTDCEDAAFALLRHVGEPTWMRMYRVSYWPNLLYTDAAADPDFDPDPDDEYAALHAYVMLGDQFASRAAGESFGDDNGIGGDNSGGFWPAHAPEGSKRYDDLEKLWVVQLESDGVGTSDVEYYNVRYVEREWHPTAGWKVTVTLEPDGFIGAGGFNLDSGTY